MRRSAQGGRDLWLGLHDDRSTSVHWIGDSVQWIGASVHWMEHDGICSRHRFQNESQGLAPGQGRARSANMTRQVADSFKHPTRAEMFEAPEAQGAGCRVQARTRTRGVQARARACVLCRGQACSRAYLHVVFAYPV